MNRFIIAAAIGVMASAALTGANAEGVTEEMLANDTENTSSILTNGMGPPPAALLSVGHPEQGKREEPATCVGL